MRNLKFKIKAVLFFCFLCISVKTNAQQLEVFIKKALKNNPEIQKFELQYKIASEKVNEVNSISNTEIGIGYFVSEPETRTGAQKAKVSVKQMFPWFGSIKARENYQTALADADYEDIVIAKRKLIVSVSQSYYNLYAIQKKKEVLIENTNLLKIYEELALSAIEVGKGSVVAILRLQIRTNELHQLLKVLEQSYLAEKTTFNKLLNLDKTSIVQVVEELRIPKVKKALNLGKIQLHPELLKYEKLYNSVEKSEFLNKKESRPMVGFGLDYISVTERPGMNFTDNGKDIVMPTLSLSIPIFNKKYKSRSKQNKLRQEVLKAEKNEKLNYLETILERAITSRASAGINNDTQIKNLKNAKDAEVILRKGYETGAIDFKEILEIQELQLKFQMNQIESVKNYYKETIIINYLTN